MGIEGSMYADYGCGWMFWPITTSCCVPRGQSFGFFFERRRQLQAQNLLQFVSKHYPVSWTQWVMQSNFRVRGVWSCRWLGRCIVKGSNFLIAIDYLANTKAQSKAPYRSLFRLSYAVVCARDRDDCMRSSRSTRLDHVLKYLVGLRGSVMEVALWDSISLSTRGPSTYYVYTGGPGRWPTVLD